MSFTCIRSPYCLCEFALMCAIALTATPVLAQQASSSPPTVAAITGGIDFANRYMFRGVRQNSNGLVTWPFVDVTVRLHSGEGPLRSIDVSAGLWNSLHSGDTGSRGPIGRPWYESRLAGTLGLRFSRGLSVASTYTTYVSPNDVFSTVKEIGVRLAVDDRGALGARAVNPYVLLAFEVDASPGSGQLDGGQRGGRYLELGAAPGYAGRRAAIAFPIKAGLSLGDFYELAGDDNTFGFVSVAGTASVPLGPVTKFGQWAVRSGFELQRLGETPQVFNGGDRSAVVASFGFALTR